MCDFEGGMQFSYKVLTGRTSMLKSLTIPAVLRGGEIRHIKVVK